MSATEQTVSGSAPGLRRNAIGLREVLFQSITDMAPGAAIAASIPAGAALAGGLAAAGGRLRPGGMPALRLVHRAAGPGDARRGIAGHLRGPRAAPGRRLPGRLGLRPGRLADPAAGAAAARVHHGGHDQLRVPRVPGEPVVAVVAGRRGDRARRRLLRRPGLDQVRHHPRDLRDRGVPGAGRVLRGARGQPQHRAGLHHALLPHRADRRDRRLGVHAARVRRLRGRRAAGRGGQGPAAHHQARGAAGHAADRPALRVHHLRRRRRLRAEAASPPSPRSPATRPGRASRARSTACSGSSCSWPSSTPPSPTPTRA